MGSSFRSFFPVAFRERSWRGWNKKNEPVEPPAAAVGRRAGTAGRRFVVVAVVRAERVAVVRAERVGGVALVALDPQTVQVLLAVHPATTTTSTTTTSTTTTATTSSPLHQAHETMSAMECMDVDSLSILNISI